MTKTLKRYFGRQLGRPLVFKLTLLLAVELVSGCVGCMDANAVCLNGSFWCRYQYCILSLIFAMPSVTCQLQSNKILNITNLLQ